MDNSSNTPNLHKQAIEAALNSDWSQAVDLNQEIIKSEPQNVDCLNRLAKAFFELGKLNQAKKLYQDVLLIDPYNPIAARNLKRISSFKKANLEFHSNEPSHGDIKTRISPSLFLQEPGITKIVNLVKVAEPQKLSTIFAGMGVKIVPKSRSIYITDFDNNYLGILPDDLSHQLLKLLNGGNKYQAFIKSVKQNGLAVFIKEIYRSKRFKNQPSFRDEYHISMPSDHISLSGDILSESLTSEEPEENES